MKGYIYQILNTNNDRRYLGSTINPKRRKSIHFSSLRNYCHHCIFLQRSFDKHGEDSFVFEIIGEFDVDSEDHLFLIEQEYLDTEEGLYNTSKNAGGGDNISNHPNRDDIVKRISETLNANISNMTEEERKEKWGRSGEKNGMFGKHRTKEEKEHLSKTHKENYASGVLVHPFKGKTHIEIFGEEKANKISERLSKMASQKIGERNPFFGKQHSDSSKEKMSVSQKEKFESMSPEERYERKKKQMKIVEIDGKIYYGLSESARRFGITPGAMLNRIKSLNYPTYRYI